MKLKLVVILFLLAFLLPTTILAQNSYYVNDNSTNGDLWCTAVGLNANTGTTPGSPKDDIIDILFDHDLDPGDTVYIDTGTYSDTAMLSIDEGGGSAGNYITFRGAGIDKTTIANVFHLYDDYLKFVNLKIDRSGDSTHVFWTEDGYNNLQIWSNEICNYGTAWGIWIRSCDNVSIKWNKVHTGGNGIIAIQAVGGDLYGLRIERNIVYNCSIGGIIVKQESGDSISVGTVVKNNTVYYCTAVGGIEIGNSTSMTVVNNIMYSNQPGGIMDSTGETPAGVVIKYNCFWANTSNAFYDADNTTYYDCAWINANRGGPGNICANPDFVSPTTDFNLMNAFSSACDTGDPIYNSEVPDGAIDMGALEFLYKTNIGSFNIYHDGYARTNTWEPVVVSALNQSGLVLSNFTGLITLDISSSFSGTITWDNISGGGSFTPLGNGLASYQFVGGDNGVVTFRIKDDSEESVNIQVYHTTVSSDKLFDTDTEGYLGFWIPVLNHFEITYPDPPAGINLWEPLTITAIEDRGFVIGDYSGTITLSAPAADGTLDWSTDGGGNCGTFQDLGDGRAVYTFDGDCDQGSVNLFVRNACQESIDIEAISTVTSKTDDDSEGLLTFTAGNIYYVNDSLDPSDEWCTDAGDDPTGQANDPGNPYATLQYVVNNINLEPGDSVYVDTGNYAAVYLNDSDDDGSPGGGYVTFTASTQGNGAIINSGGTGVAGFDLRRMQYIRIEYFKIDGNGTGENYGINLADNNTCRSNYLYRNECYNHNQEGIRVYASPDNVIYGNICHNNNAYGINIVQGGADYNVITRNWCYGNGNTGLRVYD